MTEAEYLDLFNDYMGKPQCNNRIMIYILGGLISGDTLLDVENCDNSLKQLQLMSTALNKSELEKRDKEFWQRYIDYGVYVCTRDKDKILETLERR